MQSAATTSPFIKQQTDMDSWVLWTQKESVINLMDEKQTDGRYVCERNDEKIDMEQPVSSSIINNMLQTNRYRSVLSRIDQASKRAAAYSAWNA